LDSELLLDIEAVEWSSFFYDS